MKTVEIAVYIHIPFCQRKCPYCDFNSYVGYSDLFDAYVEAICREMNYTSECGEELGISYVARTVFFGGGTPTLLGPRHFEKILRAARERFGWHPALETSTEANPGTIDVELIQSLNLLGINRISLGIQSFDDGMLRRLGRIHNSHQAIDAIRNCRRAGIKNLNLDLMFGLPGQNLDHWREALRQALSFEAEHLSLYPLTIEEDTPFWNLQEAGRLVTPTDDEVADMYELAGDMLGSCYDHYEISNWASRIGAVEQPPISHRCRHNKVYWHNDPYVGFGAGAHSFLNSERFANTKSPVDYIDRIGSVGNAVDSRERIGPSLEMGETLILGLRLLDGMELAYFEARFGHSLDEVLDGLLPHLCEQNLIYYDAEKIVLTPRGRLLANEVFAPILDHLCNDTPAYKHD